MICNSCGTENPEGAVYCMQCGSRLDGKKVCPKCGNTVDGGANFCMFCGHSFAAPIEPVPAPAPAPAPVDAVAPAYEEPVPAETRKRTVFDILGICGGALALASVLFSLIFVFCIGITITSGRTTSDGAMIYDYFYDAYDNIRLFLTQYTKDTGPLEISLYTPTVLCTIVAVLAFLAVPACSVIASILFAKQLGDGKKRPFLAYIAAAYVSFLVAACTIYTFSTVGYGSLSSVIASSEVEFGFNGATLAGIILGGVFLGIGTALIAASHGKEFVHRKTIVMTAIAIACIVPVAVGFFLARQSQISATLASGSTDVQIDINAILACAIIGVSYISNTSLPVPAGELTVAVLATVLQIAILVLLALKFVQTIRSIANEGKSGIVIPAVLAGACVLNLVLNIVFTSMFDDYMFPSTPSQLSYGYMMPIALLIMSLLILGASIAHKIIAKKKS